jgi:hypothetical protein
VPIVVFGNPDVMAVFGARTGNLPGVILLAAVAFFLWRAATATGSRK